MRLVDAVATRAANYLPEDTNLWHEWFEQTYGAPTGEMVLPTVQSFAERGFSGNAVVFGLMNRRAMLFSEAVFKYRNRANKKLFGTPDLAVLENPWPNGTTGELLVRYCLDAEIAGNAFVRRDPDRLVRLRPDWAKIIRVGSGEEEERSRWDVFGFLYQLNGPGSEEEFYPVDEVSHWAPIPDPLNDFRGMSWLTPVVREINSDLAMTDYRRRFMDNNATPNLLIKYAAKLNDTTLARVREQWNARYGGTDGMKTAVLDSGADVTLIGDGFAGIDFANVQSAVENRIAVASGVPAIVAGLKEGLASATYSNYEQAMRAFVDLTMRPMWRSACASLAKLVAPQPGADLWFDTTDIAALRQGDKERADTLLVLASAASSWITAGYDPDSVTAVLTSGDVSLLQHSGLTSVQLLPPGQTPPAANGNTPMPMPKKMPAVSGGPNGA